MVKLRGPALSQSARGSIGGTLVFSNWKGRSTLKFSSSVRNPKTAPQVGRRSMLRFLSTVYASLGASDVATWSAPAAAAATSAYNAFVSYNMERWSRYLSPTTAYPAAESVDAMGVATFTANALNRSVVLAWTRDELEDDWGYILYRSPDTGFTPSLDTVIRINRAGALDPDVFSWTDGPLSPDTYYYRINVFSTDGNLKTDFVTERSATIS